MSQEDESTSFCGSFSDFCSLGERIQGSRDQALIKQNSRLRKENSEMGQKYLKMCDEVAKLKSKLAEKDRKINELDLFYSKQIQILKKELAHKNTELSKYTKGKVRRNSESNKENQIQNLRDSVYLESCLQNQSSVLGQVQGQNLKLHNLLIDAFILLEPYLKSRENLQIQRRINLIKKQLSEKTNTGAFLGKANDILEETKAKGPEFKNEELTHLYNTLKVKTSQLQKTPLIFDYDLEAESKSIQMLFTHLDTEMQVHKRKKYHE